MREELLGVFGLSWQEKLANDLYNIYTDPLLKYNAFMTVTHGSPWNVAYINQIESNMKEGQANGLTGVDLSNYLKQKVNFANPAMADTYLKLRSTEGGSAFANILTDVVSPISKAAGGVVGAVTQPLTPIIIGVAVVAVLGFVYLNSKKGPAK